MLLAARNCSLPLLLNLLLTSFVMACGSDQDSTGEASASHDDISMTDRQSDSSDTADDGNSSTEAPSTTSTTGTQDPDAARHVDLTFVRDNHGSREVRIFMAFTSADGRPAAVNPEDLEVTIEGGTEFSRTAWELSPSLIDLIFEADHFDRRVTITVSLPASDLSVTRSIFVPPTISPDSQWSIPEYVPGLVNTPGWEDSSEISPDGQWLIVSSYTPVDMFSCILTQSDIDAPACNDSLGPWEGPERPGLFGADRIVDPQTIRHRIPSLCLVGEGEADFPVAMPPVATYGFRAQPDGTFAEPFVIGFDMDGYSVAPFGFSFVEAMTDRATVVFGHADIRDFEEKGLTPNLYVADIDLGEPTTLGTFSCTPGTGISLENDITERLEILPHTVHKGNPFLEANRSRVWFDDEGSDRSLVYFATREGETWTERNAAAEPVNVDGQASYQPFLHDSTLYWARNFNAIESARLIGSPDDSEAWRNHRVELALTPPTGLPETAPPGQIVAIGEPSRARDHHNREWLYFVAIHRTETGYDADIARVHRN